MHIGWDADCQLRTSGCRLPAQAQRPLGQHCSQVGCAQPNPTPPLYFVFRWILSGPFTRKILVLMQSLPKLCFGSFQIPLLPEGFQTDPKWVQVIPLGSLWYHSEPSEAFIPQTSNWSVTLFAISYNKLALKAPIKKGPNTPL